MYFSGQTLHFVSLAGLEGIASQSLGPNNRNAIALWISSAATFMSAMSPFKPDNDEIVQVLSKIECFSPVDRTEIKSRAAKMYAIQLRTTALG